MEPPTHHPVHSPAPAKAEGDRLVERWRTAAGEKEREEVFRALFERFFGVVTRFFASRGLSPEESGDLAQETFLRVYVHLPRFRGDSRFETWLYQIAIHRYINFLRERSAGKREGRELSLESVDPEGRSSLERVTDGEPPLAGLLREEQRQLLWRAIETMPAQMRRCVLLRVGSRLRYREIAETMQISIDTVKAHLFQARQKLKSDLGDYFTDVEL